MFHPGLLTAVSESRISDLYFLLREMIRCPWLIPPKAQNEISYTLVDCVLQIQDNVMTTMKVTL